VDLSILIPEDIELGDSADDVLAGKESTEESASNGGAWIVDSHPFASSPFWRSNAEHP
jgi:hypothetical protein